LLPPKPAPGTSHSMLRPASPGVVPVPVNGLALVTVQPAVLKAVDGPPIGPGAMPMKRT
jgi:hypothetical protein